MINTSKDNLFMTASEAAKFLRVSNPTILKAIKAKKLVAIRNGNQWNIPVKILEAYRELRGKTFSSTNLSTGINSKDIALTVIEREIRSAGVKNVMITKNYELFQRDTYKRLTEEKLIDATAWQLLCNTIYEAYSDRFFQDDIELSHDSFLQRLAKLKLFLEALKTEDKMLSAVKSAIKTSYSFSTDWVQLKACTGRVLTDQGPLLFGAQSSKQVEEVIKNFCCQGEFTSQEVLDTLKALKE